MNNIKEKFKQLLSLMSKGAFEREEVLGLTLLSSLSGESIFLLGLPGVGKSMIARRLKMVFKDATSFEYLMSRFSTPDEIFGPVSISKLKDEDTYVRAIDGYLPTSDVVFLDEIWKAGPAIQNSLLTVLNEKIFRNGKDDLAIPLKAVISASNELPAEGEGLEALWDRFLIRYIVQPIADKNNFLKLVIDEPEECTIPEELKITDEELSEIKNATKSIDVPYEIGELIYKIRDTLILEQENTDKAVDVNNSDLTDPPYVSDRRWKKIMSILRMSAYINGRPAVNYSDCMLLVHMLWDKDEQYEYVNKLIAKSMTQVAKKFNMDVQGLVHKSSYTKQLSDPISPDGENYVFHADKEEILINIEDYNQLSTSSIRYAIITDDNQLVLSNARTSLRVMKTEEGLSINAFSYPLKRDNKIRTGTVEGMLSDVFEKFNNIEDLIKQEIDENLFVQPYKKQYILQKSFTDEEGTLMKKGF